MDRSRLSRALQPSNMKLMSATLEVSNASPKSMLFKAEQFLNMPFMRFILIDGATPVKKLLKLSLVKALQPSNMLIRPKYLYQSEY